MNDHLPLFVVKQNRKDSYALVTFLSVIFIASVAGSVAILALMSASTLSIAVVATLSILSLVTVFFIVRHIIFISLCSDYLKKSGVVDWL